MKKIIITLSIFTALVGTNYVFAQQLDSTLNPPPTYTAPDNVYDNLIPYTPPTNSPGPTIQNAEGLPPAPTDVPVSGTIVPNPVPTSEDVTPKSTLNYSGWVQCDGVVALDGTKKPIEPGRTTTCNFMNLIVMVNHLINWAFAISIPVIVGIFAYAGFKLMAQSEAALKEGKAMMWNALIGFAIMLTAWFLVTTALGWILDSEFLKTATSITGK